MSKHIGEIGKRITAEVKLVGEYSYETTFGYYPTTNYIYTMQDAEGNILVWKTTAILAINTVRADGETVDTDIIRKGDTMTISGTVKEHSEYRGTAQTVLTRCKYTLIAHKPDEVAIKREQQMQSLAEGDRVWEMPYRQYKAHYADCETVAGSYDDHEGRDHATIKVIIREGRLKNSGVRGEHYSGYRCTAADGTTITYRAVCEENALKRAAKEFPNCTGWECTHIYRYETHRIW